MGRRQIFFRVVRTTGLTLVIAVGLYLYQPQRYILFPEQPPNPNPAVDPDLTKLFSPGTRVAIVAAHPDDPEFFIGGILAKLAMSHAKVLIVMCTDGDKAYYPPFFTNPAENRRVRRLEQMEAASHYQAQVDFLGNSDGRLWADRKLVVAVRDSLNAFHPDYVFAFDTRYPPRIQHSDHLESGFAAERAIPEVPSAKWFCRFSTRAANCFVDITDAWPMQQKLIAIHKSQFSGDHLIGILAMVEDRAQDDGAHINVDYAEGLRCTQLQDRHP